jgi:aspartate 1-decarboxylase
VIPVNGAAAHKAAPGDRIIICAYAGLDAEEMKQFKPTLVYLDESNQVIRTGNTIPTQAA